ncbi:MAG TPA: TIM barrel protein [Verrucomicrobiales bacterium]|nr:TIM barrel protein [Verrucomicrobiales bacterium]
MPLIRPFSAVILGFLLLSGALAQSVSSGPSINPPEPGAGPFARGNLVAWCVVPFDAKKRGPEERAAMLDRLGLRRLAYDWRAEHIPTFDAEIEAMLRHGIELTAWWFPAAIDDDARAILEAIERHELKTQLWVSLGDPAPGDPSQEKKIAAAVAALQPIAKEAHRLGCKLGLYNHGGWFGQPENQIAVLQALGQPHAGLVYNFHHGHEHLDRFAELFPQMQAHLLCVNLNGMIAGGDAAGKKILPVGDGDREAAMIEVIRASGYTGLIGILDHRPELDAEEALRLNLDGLEGLLRDDLPTADKP